jgi:hypothetical protein
LKLTRSEFISLKPVEGACMGVVDVPKVGKVRPLRNLHMGKVQVMVEWKVHATPPCVLKWDGIFGIHRRKQ